MQPSGGGIPAFFTRPSSSSAIKIVRPPADGSDRLRSPSKLKEGGTQICRDLMIDGACSKTDCPFSHPSNGSPRIGSPTFASDASSTPSLAAAVSAPVFVPKAAPASAASPPPVYPSRSTIASPEPLQSDDSQDYGYADRYDQSMEYLNDSMQSLQFNPYDSQPDMSMGYPSDYDLYDQHMSGFFPPAAAPYLQQPLDYHLYTLPIPSALSHNYFMSDDLREELQRRSAAVRAVPHAHFALGLPDELQGYHTLVPLDDPASLQPGPGQERRKFWNWLSSVYKAVGEKDGVTYALRRIENFRLMNAQGLTPIDAWSRVKHPNIITVHEGFTTRAFGDHSLVVAYAHHPNAQTLGDLYLKQPHPFTPTASGTGTPVHTPGGGRHAPFGAGRGARGYAPAAPARIPERTLWSFIVQIANAVRAVHDAGLAVRVLDPARILVTGKNRVRLASCGIVDVLTHDARQPQDLGMLQQEDLAAFGRLVFLLGCGHAGAVNNPQKALDTLGRHYSADVGNVALFLVSKPTPKKNISQLFDMLGTRLLTEMDEMQNAVDRLEGELMSELENGRLVRLLCKFGFINERPEFARDMRWSDTGDRYIIKLFRDYVFHQVDEMGNPLVNLGHVLTCLSKLDAGTDERIMLLSRDEQSCLVVSYKDIKTYVETAFEELSNPSATAL